MNPTRIIIIGGGFAGVRCARTLRKRLAPDRCEIVLFDRENSMVYYPLLAEVAGATIGPDSVATPLRQLLPNVRCRNEEVRRIDHAASEVEYEGYDGRLRRMGFHHAVIACGSSVNLNLVPGMADHAFPLKSVSDAMALRFHDGAARKGRGVRRSGTAALVSVVCHCRGWIQRRRGSRRTQ